MIKMFTVKNVLIGCGILGIPIILVWLGLYTNTIKLSITRTISHQYVTDFSDDRKLMGASHNVFVGKVIRQVGSKSRTGTPETQFEVEVIHNIKGNLQGSVTVNQEGGYKNGVLYLIHEGDVVLPADKTDLSLDPLLEPGQIYLFASRYSERDNWYTIISHPNAKANFSLDNNLTKPQLEILVENNGRVRQLREAYPNEILLDVDVKINNARNSYKSLQKD